jgi:hypothetical protein
MLASSQQKGPNWAWFTYRIIGSRGDRMQGSAADGDGSLSFLSIYWYGQRARPLMVKPRAPRQGRAAEKRPLRLLWQADAT